MNEKDTIRLEEILGSTHPNEFKTYCTDNKDSMRNESNSFYVYMKNILKKKGITQQRLFIDADMPERYGYKLLSGEKRTKQRDVILRICYAATLSLKETQRALRKYEMAELYAKVPRDALLMILFTQKPGSVIDVNGILKENGFEPLRNRGMQD